VHRDRDFQDGAEVAPIAPKLNRTWSKARSLGAFFLERFRTSNRCQKERFGNDCAGTARRDGPDPGEQDLWSFAALTDEPRPEIAETGHQRCVIALQQPSLREWLSPVGVSRERLNAILGQREAAYYKHQIAA
jgi:hypothetical protein